AARDPVARIEHEQQVAVRVEAEPVPRLHQIVEGVAEVDHQDVRREAARAPAGDVRQHVVAPLRLEVAARVGERLALELGDRGVEGDPHEVPSHSRSARFASATRSASAPSLSSRSTTIVVSEPRARESSPSNAYDSSSTGSLWLSIHTRSRSENPPARWIC